MRALTLRSSLLALLPLLALPLISISSASAQTTGYDVDLMSQAAVQVRVADGTGSGTLLMVDDSALVFTNRHVVEGFDEATIAVLTDVNAPAEPMFVARLVGYSDAYDFAVYAIDRDLQGNSVSTRDLNNGRFGISVPRIEVHDANNKQSGVRRGDVVGIFGYPGIGDDDLVYSTGIISSVQYGEYNDQRLPMWYRTTAEMSPGNSGGMALSASGEFIGIPTSVRTEYQTGGRLGSLLAVPFVMAILDDEDGLQTSWATLSRSGSGDELDYGLEPAFGSASLSASELGEPYRADLVSGGSIDTFYLGGECVGYASDSPDFRLLLDERIDSLGVWFTADDEYDDTTLIINGPDGEWHCNDDSAGSLDPALSFSNARSGQYDIWIGSYSSGEYVSGVLSIVDESRFEGDAGAAADAGLDWSAESYYGSAELSAGFVPDPHRVDVMAGGSVDINRSAYGDECRGYASSAPDLNLHWSGGGSRLQVYFVAEDNADATLIINTPDGQWLCNDDAAGTLNPGITISNPSSGRYDIWTGAYSQGEFINGELFITELSTPVP